jgi:hypothetical protein
MGKILKIAKMGGGFRPLWHGEFRPKSLTTEAQRSQRENKAAIRNANHENIARLSRNLRPRDSVFSAFSAISAFQLNDSIPGS